MKKKNLIIFLTTTQSPHFEAGFHYAKKNSKKYNKIYFVNLYSKVNYRHEFTWRNHCSLKVNISRKIRNGFNKDLYYFFEKLKNNKYEFINLDEKKVVQDSKLLHSIIETYTSNELATTCLKTFKYESILIDSINKAIGLMYSLLDQYKFSKNDDFVLFNGRLPLDYCVRHILQKKGYKKILFHEYNLFENKIYFLNHSIHSLHKYSNEIINFYKNNKNSVIKKWNDTRKIKYKKLKKVYVTYFTSSVDEYKFTYAKPIDQSKIIQDLINFKFPKNFKLKIRVHPNTHIKSDEVKMYWNRLKKLYPKIIINYDEKISSHNLCMKSLFTISIGSSLAAESLLLETPHLLIGKQNFYFNMPGYFKCNENDLSNFLNYLFVYFAKNQKKIISLKDKKFAASSVLFMKDLGEKINLTFLGNYPKDPNYLKNPNYNSYEK